MYVFASLSTSTILLITVVDSLDYISRFTNLRHLTFANLVPTPRGHYKRTVGGETSFAWIVGVIAALRSPITHLTIEILVHEPADLKAVDWTAIDVLLSRREVLRSLVQVSVVFLDKLENADRGLVLEGTAHPVTIRRLMPLTSMMGLLTFFTRGPKL